MDHIVQSRNKGYDALFLEETDDEDAEEVKKEYIFDLNTTLGWMHFLTLPYFKSTVDDGTFMVAPVLEDVRLPFRLTYVLQRQKLTDRIIKDIKVCVIQTLQEELERRLQDHFESCLLKMDLTDGDISVIKSCQTDTQLVDATVKICVDRELVGKQEPSYAPVMCYVKCPDRKFTVLSNTKSLYDLVQFKFKCAKDIKQMDFVEFSKRYPIDWLSVSKKMLDHRHFKSPDECERLWKLKHSPEINREAFSFEEINEVLKVLKITGVDNIWHELTKIFNNGRTDFQYFQMYSSLLKCPKEYNISCDLQKQLVNSYLTYQDFNVLAAQLSDAVPQINADIVRAIYSRTLNPMLRKTHATPIEDAILLAAMELEKDELIGCDSRDNLYHSVMEWMPWRFTDVLKERFEILFHLKSYPFTKEEDELLLAAVDAIGQSWGEITQLFISNKTRKICAMRYRVIKDWSKAQFESFHSLSQKPSSLTWSSPLMLVLYKLTKVLQEWDSHPYICRDQLSRFQPPTEEELHLYIRSFPLAIIQKTFDKVIDHCHHNLEYQPLEHYKQYDRTKFDRKLSVSWASALHLRQIDLKPLDAIQNPSDFELAIYAHYAKYWNSGPSKANIMKESLRKIPPAEKLVKYPEISRIVNVKINPTTTNHVAIKMERIPQNEIEEAEVHSGAGIDSSHSEFMDCGSRSDVKYFIQEEKVKIENGQRNEDVKDIEPPKCVFRGDEEPQVRRKTGPKASRIKQLRSEAAKARWAKKKELETKPLLEIKVTTGDSIDKVQHSKKQSEQGMEKLKRDLKSFKSSINIIEKNGATEHKYPIPTNIKKEPIVLNIKTEHNYCKTLAQT